MKLENSEILELVLFFLVIVSFTGWYFAQQDNELLRQELAAQKMTQPVHHYKDIDHD
ncbi:hypothetical protein [Acinetobacter wuhouensis]|uniref:hypothetical protein n=1 Tax=Acinetobacter wuhouensis TaxID=1879050 RepID=UPI0013CEC952|nr:hypothetical protein [Acinetobacter wuhouensis]